MPLHGRLLLLVYLRNSCCAILLRNAACCTRSVGAGSVMSLSLHFGAAKSAAESTTWKLWLPGYDQCASES
ncbi:uncharacterized protein PHACADRAFT_254134 [Phanerochaete carnosa HHB-10118-sp]|uniref:Secreted protein n=1 Tax=Phanerochaete carnosa (strain HHB-10118-sp) TaxID=650164 RepID=K5WCV2_PHACS|nr:uncharacterized protein PHACADRAFT_254134 [Phanerochaete carnosa HHB-10118-sp]EKM56809.1 hypothetical protein PHACADRAFT_254134 [Phanerochaete carnosa HHB-10118-sp]